jgi:hypothetical protein
MALIASGAPVVPAMGAFGPIIDKKTKKQVFVPASIGVQVQAFSELADRGHGKPMQAIAHSGSIDLDADQAKAQLAAGVAEFLGSISK